jgi:DNA-binding IclR family transcriptional regulator
MVLSLLSRHPDASFTLSEICQRLDLNVSTAHSLLNALTAAEFLVRQPTTKRYSLGPELVRIGAAAASRPVTQSPEPSWAATSLSSRRRATRVRSG